MALVSIITPAYNCRNTIKGTYDSVLSQTFKDWEWIIVDDCSKDDSFSLVKELAKNEPRIIVLQTPKNGGSAVARNIALKHASGRYITFLDSDDLTAVNYDREIGNLFSLSNDTIKIIVYCYDLTVSNETGIDYFLNDRFFKGNKEIVA